MLTNYITTEDLEVVYADILAFRRGGQVDFTTAIGDAFNTLISDLQQRGKNVRLLMIPQDMNRDNASPMLQYLKQTDLSGDDTGYAWEGIKGREGRLAVNMVSKDAGTAWTVTLQGSNESAMPAIDSTYWTTVCALTIEADAAVGMRSTTFTTRYRWYRRVVASTGGGGNILFTCALEETTFDKQIVNKAIELISAGIDTGQSQMWTDRAARARENYDNGLKAIQFSIDENEDGTQDGDPTVSGTSTAWR